MTKAHCVAGVLAMAAVLFLSGCASRSVQAERTAARMLDPRVTPMEETLLRQELIACAPESDPFLASAWFPIGLYDVPEDSLFDIASAGFNLIVNGDTSPSYLEKAEALGLRVIPYIRLEHMEEDVQAARGARAIAAWYLADEPDINDMPPEKYLDLSRRLHKLDPTRPVFLTVQSPRKYGEYMPGCDIFAPDPYPIRHEEAQENNLWIVPGWVFLARQAARDRPVWAVLQAFWADPVWPRNPTADELRAMTFMALNHGARGVLYFSYKSGDKAITEHDDLYTGMMELNAQLAALHAALLLPPLAAPLRFNVVSDEGGPTVRHAGARQEAPAAPPPPPPPLDCSLRVFRKAHLFIAVNPAAFAKTVQVFLPDWLSGRTAREIYGQFEPEDPLKIKLHEPLPLEFEAYETRIFWVE